MQQSFLQPKDIVPGRYRHFKGKEYQVVAVAKHSKTEEWLVVYYPLYPCPEGRCFWVRPLAMFQEQVQQNGSLIPRFALVEAAENDCFF